MNRMFLTGALAVAAGALTLMAQEAKQPQPKSQKEVEALQALFNAQTPDERITAADQLLIKFADTEFKAIALYLAAASYEQKNDFDKMVIYAERTLEADPKNYASMLMLASGIAKRTREFDLDKEEKLAKSEKYAKQALEIIPTAPKPNPQLTDEQWAGAKKDFEAQAYEAFGLCAMVRKKYDAAIENYRKSVETANQPDPAVILRLAQAYNLAEKPDEALSTLEKLKAIPDLHPQIQQIAQAEKVRAMQKKGGAKPPQ